MSWKKEIEYRYSEYSNLVEIDECILDKTIDLTDMQSLYLAKEGGRSVLLGVFKESLMYRNKYTLKYLSSSFCSENDVHIVEHDWFHVGDLER